MKHEDHIKKAIELTGKPFVEVHDWLDELFKWFGPDHRDFRHNAKGIEYIRKRYGDEAADVARQHIIDDGEDPEK